MNLSVDQQTAVNGASGATARTPRLWPVLAALLSLPLLQQGLATRSQNLLISMVSVMVAYVLAIYLFKAVAVAVFYGALVPVAVTALIAVVASGLLDATGQLQISMVGTAVIPLTGIMVGRKARTLKSPLRLYLVGAALVVVAGLVMYGTAWSMIMLVWRGFATEYAPVLQKNMTMLGYHAEVAEEYGRQFLDLMNNLARIIPAVLVSYPLLQFSVAFLWLTHSGLPAGVESARLAPFYRWKIPFGLAPVLIVVILGRLYGGESITLVADNVLLILSIVYCVGGLSLLDHLLRRLQFPKLVKVLFYVMLTLTGILGYLLTVLIGFIDSFADWRKISTEPIELKKE